MKKFQFYKLGTLGVLIFMLFTMTGCTIPFLNRAPESISLKYESLWENEQVYSDVFTSYKDIAPNVSVSFEDRSYISLEVYKKDLLERLSSNREVPDVLRIHASWLPEFRKYLTPAPQEMFNKQVIEEKYYPSVGSIVVYKTVDGSQSYVYGIPLYYDQLNLVYNKAHFAEAGLTPPTTWEQFFRAAYFLTKKDSSGNITRSAGAFGDKNIEFYTDTFGYLLGNASVNFPNVTSQDIEAIESVVRVLNRSTDWNPEFANSGNAFASRRVSMIFAPAWRVNDILTANPTIELAVAPMPSSRIENPQNWSTFFIEVVPANGKNPAEAWKFLQHMSSEASAQSIYSKQASLRALPSLPALKNLANTIEVHPILKSMSSNALSSKSAFGTGSSFVMSDRAGNTQCTDAIKIYASGNASGFIQNINLVAQSCGLSQ